MVRHSGAPVLVLLLLALACRGASAAVTARRASGAVVTPVFNASEAEAIYTSASIARASGSAPASALQFGGGTWLAPPFGCTVYNSDGSVALRYVWPNAQDEVDLKTYGLHGTGKGNAAGVTTVCVANVVHNAGAGAKTVTVLAFAPTSTAASPVWTFDFAHNCQTDAMDPVADAALSDDGTTLALLATCRNSTDPFIAQVHVLNLATGSETCLYSVNGLASQAGGESISLSADGHFAAFNNYEQAYVLDTRACVLRGVREEQPIQMGFQGAVAMSRDALYVAYCFESGTLLRWNASLNAYALAYTTPAPLPNSFCEALALGGNGLLAMGYTDGNAATVYVQLYDVTGDGTAPLWTFDGPTSHDDQLIPSDMAVSGDFVAVATWGDYGESSDPCPQVYLFHRSTPVPVFSYITPGSMFAIDVLALPSSQSKPYAADAAHEDDTDDAAALVATATNGAVSAAAAAAAAATDVWVCASGKHVHANVMGNGGDLFVFRTTFSTA